MVYEPAEFTYHLRENLFRIDGMLDNIYKDAMKLVYSHKTLAEIAKAKSQRHYPTAHTVHCCPPPKYATRRCLRILKVQLKAYTQHPCDRIFVQQPK